MLVETGEEDLREPERWDFFSAEGDGISRNGARPLVSPVDFFCIGKKASLEAVPGECGLLRV